MVGGPEANCMVKNCVRTEHMPQAKSVRSLLVKQQILALGIFAALATLRLVDRLLPRLIGRSSERVRPASISLVRFQLRLTYPPQGPDTVQFRIKWAKSRSLI